MLQRLEESCRALGDERRAAQARLQRELVAQWPDQADASPRALDAGPGAPKLTAAWRALFIDTSLQRNPDEKDQAWVGPLLDAAQGGNAAALQVALTQWLSRLKRKPAPKARPHGRSVSWSSRDPGENDRPRLVALTLDLPQADTRSQALPHFARSLELGFPGERDVLWGVRRA